MVTPFYGLSAEDLSVEANSDQNDLSEFLSNPTFDNDFGTLFENNSFGDINISGTCNENFLAESLGLITELNEFEEYFPDSTVGPNASSEIDQNLLVLPTKAVNSTGRNKRKSENKKTIPLSSSVGVGVPQKISTLTSKIEIIYDLEETYRPRYKSDYFTIGGRNRKPRYVSDRFGNHFISLKVPLGIRGQIRIDWVTIPDADNTRYVMPYQFQASNDSSDISDCNPIFEPIQCDKAGVMKIYLVLIKAKQDALKSLQPLQPFHPFQDAFGISDKETRDKFNKLTPKQLIQKYQLGKSQLAFTLCSLGSDNLTYHPEWDTTVYSTILEEEVNESSLVKTVSCPKCSCAIILNDEIIKSPEIPVSKRKKKQLSSSNQHH